MSFIITMYVREGIVMASDSRLTYSKDEKKEDTFVSHVAIGLSDSNYKTFLSPHNIGISTCGQAEIKGVPISGYVESFINEKISTSGIDVDDIPKLLLEYFRRFDPIPHTTFHIAGYKNNHGQKEQRVWNLSLSENKYNLINPPGKYGVSWAGEGDILARILSHSCPLTEDGKTKDPFSHFPIPYQFFTLQDAIDFCVFSVRSTIDAIRFQPRPKTVGGPIDVLVIKPDKAFWIQRKELHV